MHNNQLFPEQIWTPYQTITLKTDYLTKYSWAEALSDMSGTRTIDRPHDNK